MSTILLQLEAALADTRAALERAAEKLHDTGVAHALAKSQYDAAADAVKRVEGALNSMHGVASTVPEVISQSRPTGSGLASPPAPSKKPRKEPEGQGCPGCGEKGQLGYVMQGTVKFATCSACKGMFQA